ncbi:hypothetical protein [Acanthopleuribacter pedis]|uniref:Uncharacterized protein n=1 Tax=Acanthopleuribacter pedis TaxID=442870 RepID=A0A8J7QP47_9BACT|nr:hypothetical protein [Acanthopleuribacter pedis]MBO1322043.1 hypothetical protein [Acanthopleuribacter pedis]
MAFDANDLQVFSAAILSDYDTAMKTNIQFENSRLLKLWTAIQFGFSTAPNTHTLINGSKKVV